MDGSVGFAVTHDVMQACHAKHFSFIQKRVNEFMRFRISPIGDIYLGVFLTRKVKNEL